MSKMSDFSNENIIEIFKNLHADPNECWICAGAVIRKLPNGEGRPLFMDKALRDACVNYLRSIGRPELQLKGEEEGEGEK